MTRTALQRWSRIADQRRAAIAGRAAEGGGACTLIVIREPDGRLLLSFEGTWRTCAELSPDAHAALVEALTELVRRRRLRRVTAYGSSSSEMLECGSRNP